MATRRKEIDRKELAELVRDVLSRTEPEMLTLLEIREALADDETYGVQCSAEELAEMKRACQRVKGGSFVRRKRNSRATKEGSWHGRYGVRDRE